MPNYGYDTLQKHGGHYDGAFVGVSHGFHIHGAHNHIVYKPGCVLIPHTRGMRTDSPRSLLLFPSDCDFPAPFYPVTFPLSSFPGAVRAFLGWLAAIFSSPGRNFSQLDHYVIILGILSPRPSTSLFRRVSHSTSF